MTFCRCVAAATLCLTVLLFDNRQAAAEIALVFGPTSSGSPKVNETFDVSIYLEETGTPFLSPQGLKTFGLQGVFGTGLALEPFSPSSTPFLFPSAFYPASHDFVAGTGTFTVSAEGDPTLAEMRTGFILLGTVRFKALAAGTTTLTLRDPVPGISNNSFTLGSGLGVDDRVFAPLPGNVPKEYAFEVNVAAVPEPGSMSLVGLAGAGLWLVRRRKRARAK